MLIWYDTSGFQLLFFGLAQTFMNLVHNSSHEKFEFLLDL